MLGTITSSQGVYGGQPPAGTHSAAAGNVRSHQGHSLVAPMSSDSYRETGAAAEAATLYALT